MPEPGNVQVVGESRGVKSGEFGVEGNIGGRVWASEFLRVGEDWNGSGRGVGRMVPGWTTVSGAVRAGA